MQHLGVLLLVLLLFQPTCFPSETAWSLVMWCRWPFRRTGLFRNFTRQARRGGIRFHLWKNQGKSKSIDDEWSIWFTSVIIWNDFWFETPGEGSWTEGPLRAFPILWGLFAPRWNEHSHETFTVGGRKYWKWWISSAMLVIIIITIAIISINQKTQSKDHQRCPNEMSFHGPMAFWSLPGRQSFKQDGPLLVVKRS